MVSLSIRQNTIPIPAFPLKGKETKDQVFGSVTPVWPWYLPPRSL